MHRYTTRALSLVEAGERILNESEPMIKVAMSLETQEQWQSKQLPLSHQEKWPGNPPKYPARSARPLLFDPKDMPSDKSYPIPVSILHALAHIELGAIDNYWDTVCRFEPRPKEDKYDLPIEFYDDFVNVACDEARHLKLVEDRLQELNSFYGQLPAHRALLEHAANTRNALAARLAVIPLVQEARGLDAGPRLVHKLKSIGDPLSAEIVGQIVFEERGHVAKGIEWFTFLCGQIDRNPIAYFHQLVREYFPEGLPGPFNLEARLASHMPPTWFQPLEMERKKMKDELTKPKKVVQNRPSNGKTLVVAGCVWPERTSSAAGVRTTEMIEMAQEEGWNIICISPCRLNNHTELLTASGVTCIQLDPNTSQVEEFLKENRVDVILFDRFISEEMYAWKFFHHAPNATRILDLQDVHFLRKAREHLVLKEKVDFTATLNADINVDAVMPNALRELASIYRSDITLYVSEFEKDLLQGRFGISQHQLKALDYILPTNFHSTITLDNQDQQSFEDRKHIAVVGSFKHPPNVDGLKWLTTHVWPQARKALNEDVELHIYGSYATAKDYKLFDAPKSNVHLVGFCDDVHQTLAKYRLSLAPLRFGAGIKGKILDSWIANTPVVSTSVGSEGLHYKPEKWGGLVADSPLNFASQTSQLYNDKELWTTMQSNAFNLCKHYSRDVQKAKWIDVLSTKVHDNWIGKVLWSSQFRATEYMSRFIQAKNTLGKDKSRHILSSQEHKQVE
ncbi:hypothetical protein THRCLA_08195 [Thraustotheca clavata]|uniref:Glycosyltransferase n=1 Tax=Thraustotheca clavata TaxID=74557 RepID=A0A1V9Z8J4_9STRA|nr:hypothetical protein THRCLA_08195 [Thraustotheca clavata]